MEDLDAFAIECEEENTTKYALLFAEAAHDILYRGKNVGKVVLTVK